jgi:hypothetical protein
MVSLTTLKGAERTARRWQIEAGRAWCHRHLVAAWLKGELGIEVGEL